MPEGEDGTRRDHLIRVWDSTGQMPEQMLVKPLPWHLEYLWGYFRELNRRRSNSGFGPNSLSDELIDRWEARQGIRLHDWEYRAIMAADDAFMEAQAEATKIRSKKAQ